MTLTLATLRSDYVFESTPQRHDLGALHVPFDDLVGNTRTETRLKGAIRRGERAAIIGASGSGKSSVMAHVLGPTADGVAPLIVPLAAMPGAIVDNPSHLVDHLVATVARQATHGSTLDPVAATADRTETTTTTNRGGLAAGWGWIKGELAREVKRQTEIERTATFADKTDILAQVLNTITANNLYPVLVFDDTDRWLSDGGPKLVNKFFGEGLRWLLELPAGLAVAVHPNYFDDTPQAELLQYLDTQITIPRLESAAAIESIYARRIEQFTQIDNPDLTTVIDAEAFNAIHHIYDTTASLRRAIHVTHIAVHDALDAGDHKLSERHIVASANAG